MHETRRRNGDAIEVRRPSTTRMAPASRTRASRSFTPKSGEEEDTRTLKSGEGVLLLPIKQTQRGPKTAQNRECRSDSTANARTPPTPAMEPRRAPCDDTFPPCSLPFCSRRAEQSAERRSDREDAWEGKHGCRARRITKTETEGRRTPGMARCGARGDLGGINRHAHFPDSFRTSRKRRFSSTADSAERSMQKVEAVVADRAICARIVTTKEHFESTYQLAQICARNRSRARGVQLWTHHRRTQSSSIRARGNGRSVPGFIRSYLARSAAQTSWRRSGPGPGVISCGRCLRSPRRTGGASAAERVRSLTGR